MEGDNPWPADMERRRLADLARFFRKNPQYLQSLSIQQQTKNQNGGKGSSASLPSTRIRKLSVPENKWDVATTLELIEAMKAFVRNNKRPIGGDIRKWTEIATHLSNPRGLELGKFARSCQVRYENVRRYMRGTDWKRMRVGKEVLHSMQEYFDLYDLYPAPGFAKAPTFPSTLAIEKGCPQTSMETEESLPDDADIDGTLPSTPLADWDCSQSLMVQETNEESKESLDKDNVDDVDNIMSPSPLPLSNVDAVQLTAVRKETGRSKIGVEGARNHFGVVRRVLQTRSGRVNLTGSPPIPVTRSGSAKRVRRTI